MKRRVVALALVALAVTGCSTGYVATPQEKQTPASVPSCFIIERTDDGVHDHMGADPLGRYCLAHD